MTRPARRRGLRGLIFAGVGLVASASLGAAFAYWSSTDSSNPAAAVADSIEAGNTPTLAGINGQDVTLNWAASTTTSGTAVSGYTVARYSVASGGTPTAASGGCSGTVAALTCTEQSAPSGTWYYAVTPRISLWSGAESGRVAVSIDNTAPVTTDNTASIGGAWFNTTKTVTLSPTDTGGSGVAATYYTIDGSTPTTSSAQGTSVVLSTDGVYTVKYFSVDAVGNAESVKTAGTAIRIDKTNPTPATLSIPAAVKNGHVLSNAATDATVNGASSGVASVSYSYCSGALCTPSILIGTSSTGPNFSVMWSSQPADGAYRVQAVVTDVAGNTASTNIASTTVDNTAPSGGSVTYTNGYFTTASVAVTFTNGTDGGSGIATRQLQRASATLTNGSCGTFGSIANVGPSGPTSPYADTSVASGYCYQYQYLVTDNAGNTTTYTSANVAKVDTTAPTFAVTTSGANIISSGMTVYFDNPAGSRSFTVSATDPESGVASSTFPAAPSGWSVAGSGNARTYTWTNAGASSSITVSATNGAGTSSGNQTVTITYDNTLPAFASTDLAIAPIDNTTTPRYVHQGGQYYVYATASDLVSGIATVVANVNNITTGQTAVPLVAGTYNAFGTTYGYRSAALTANNPLAAGTKSYTATATDNVGNAQTRTASPSALVDNTNPTGSITAPSNGWAGASTTVTSNSADATAGVASALFRYAPAGSGAWTTIASDTSGPYSVPWDTTALTDGANYDLQVITTDNASNSFTSTTVTVTVDLTAPPVPSVPVLSPASDSGVAGDNITNDTTPTFTGTAQTGAYVLLYEGATFLGYVQATGGTYSITTSALAQGVHTITATASDDVGNFSSPSGAVTVTIDTTRPTPVAVTLANGGVAQKIDTGDTATTTYSEQLNASTFCSAWTSNATTQSLTNVTVTVGDNGTSDRLSVSTPSCTFHLSNGGNTLLTADYVNLGGATSATFTSSTVTWDPVARTLTLTIGTLATSNTIYTGVIAKAPKYTPDTTLADLAGNTMQANVFTDPTISGF